MWVFLKPWQTRFYKHAWYSLMVFHFFWDKSQIHLHSLLILFDLASSCPLNSVSSLLFLWAITTHFHSVSSMCLTFSHAEFLSLLLSGETASAFDFCPVLSQCHLQNPLPPQCWWFSCCYDHWNVTWVIANTTLLSTSLVSAPALVTHYALGAHTVWIHCVWQS